MRQFVTYAFALALVSLMPTSGFSASDEAIARRILNDHEIKGLHQGAKKKFFSCQPLNKEALELKAPSNGTRAFEVNYWCFYEREMESGQRTEIKGTVLPRTIKLEGIEFSYAESDR